MTGGLRGSAIRVSPHTRPDRRKGKARSALLRKRFRESVNNNPGGVPMKRLTDFIVNKRIVILAVMLILTAVSIFLIPKVGVNSDMT